MLNIITLLSSYLIGSISFALVIGKLFYKTDIRGYGSGNLGATNTFRVLGKRAGTAVAIADILKGIGACLLPQIFNSTVSPILCGILVICGHAFPIFAGFKGGKAVATSAGVFIFLSPLGTCTAFIVFLISLLTSKYVSLSSILASISIVIYSFIFEDKLIIALSLFISLFVIILHRENIKRILKGTETKVGKKK
ncbi:glycerol-3-phosphate 1-O-acyltransferase PlsY [Peribacillus butanolivorans]|uniref:Glycerol-3-phosphate acyltransferase n=1 Tax=Peribacillus butanolivorans TaxID=421767 RepID=A0AAX0S4B2_9BACI|nr:glycerol-3-phosphate 1-O-acyltransferase PlsY [Peribacillus butanolivorans]PEJ32960.1 acyl-phosphate glycerol 3-phosphate acyltransferase [Peribacillus butanolivorans]QNU03141.1 glycerol-3-phosphate 1-O-acyltransferase PlsY [Peribacillus butanolivorans]